MYQVDATGLAGDFAPLRSLDAYSTNLPSQLTSFVGRDDEIKALTTLVRAHRLVTLTGVGGVGKTRLALRVAAEVLPEARDGVWLCELAAADAEEAVLEIVTRALGVVPRPGMSALDSILDHLRGRDCLIVLDNCEHVLDIAADLTDAILRGCEHVRVLATSREGLGIDGEQLRPIRSLPVPEMTTAAAALSTDADDAVRRAGRGRRTDVSASTTPTRRPWSRSAAGSTASRSRSSSPPPASRASSRPRSPALLDERFRLLTGSRRRTVERHQTLRATVDWSYSLLRDVERTVFDRLGTFVGSFDATAAQSVVADDVVGRFDVLDALGELVAKSMLVAEPTPDGTTRYQLLETLRQYALERLEQTGEVDVYRRRHAEHYVTVTAELGRAIYGPDEVRARARLDRETDNLRAAVDWSIDAGESELVRGLIVPIAREAAWNRGSEVGGWAERAPGAHGRRPDAVAVGTPRDGPQSVLRRRRHGRGAPHRRLRARRSRPSRGPRLDALVQRAISLAGLGDIDGCIAVLDDAWRQDHGRSRRRPSRPDGRSAAGCNLAIYLAIVGETSRAADRRAGLAPARAGARRPERALARALRGRLRAPRPPIRPRAVGELRGSLAVQRPRRVEHRA